MGSGKSHFSKLLASHLDLPFFDLDNEIEKYAGKTIFNIFKDDGEVKFRALESFMLQKTIADNSIFVMACGGGALLAPSNLTMMLNSGLTIYLNPRIETIYSRLKSERSSRPIIAALSDHDLFDFIQRHWNERRKCYEQCDITILSEITNDMIQELEKALSRFS